MNLKQLFQKFPTQEDCISHLEQIRWGNKPVCPYCQSHKISKHNNNGRQNWQCQTCTRSFSVTVGTIFHHTHLDLRNWFYIIALIVNAKKGISSCQVSRDIGVRQGTVWKIMHKIREILGTKDGELLKGIVFEMDETYVKTNKNTKADKKDNDIDDDLPDDWDDNGKPTTKRGRGSKNNTAVVGIKEKGGDIKAIVVDNVKYSTLVDFAKNSVKLGSEIQTDEFKSYKRFGKFFNHKTVNHQREYVSSKNITTNGVEGFWSLLKRGIKGQFHHLSKFYLQKYINEFCYRYNMRFTDEAFVFDDVVRKLLLLNN